MYITLVRPRKWKGVDIFLKIAHRMPDRKFLAVGDADRLKHLKKTKNIKYISFVEDMRIVYSQTRLLLVPSIWQEAFGRVVIEAMVNGIPCIASDIGGLAESIGPGGILIKDILNVRKWVEAIESLDDKKFYDKLSKRAIKHANKFNFKPSSIEIFEKLIEPFEEKVRLKKWLRRFRQKEPTPHPRMFPFLFYLSLPFCIFYSRYGYRIVEQLEKREGVKKIKT